MVTGLRRDFSWLLAQQGGTLAAGMVTGALVNRALGPEGRGVYAELQTWVGLLLALGGLSLESGIRHFANRARYGDDSRARLTTVACVSVSLSLLAALLWGLVARQWPGLLSPQAAALTAVIALLLALSMTSAHLLVLLQSLGLVRQAAWAGIVQTLLGAAAIVVAFERRAIDVEFLALWLAALQAFSLFALAGIAWSRGLGGGAFSPALAAGMFSAGLRQHAATVATFIYTRVNQLIVQHQCGAAEAGLFAVALNLATVAMVLPSTFQTVLYPRVLQADDDFEVTVRSLRLGFYGWGALVLAIALAARPLLLLYAGGQFLGALPLLRVLLVGAWFLPLSSLVAPYCIKAGAFTACSLTAVVLALLSMAANAVLVPRLLGLGAALATSATCCAGFLLALGLLWRVAGRSPLAFLRLPSPWRTAQP
ncbi:MAG TPA: lipopolysaccharide biosynthesis protein [bacterium]